MSQPLQHGALLKIPRLCFAKNLKSASRKVKDPEFGSVGGRGEPVAETDPVAKVKASGWVERGNVIIAEKIVPAVIRADASQGVHGIF
ncbi:hypothetical protein OH491_18750 [Termitidicoccus mucosus]|uniref:hypothetical protein n=1 Tax=Termitidicoccus mucosus TaxID=1184151 RepID=UPI0011AB5C54